MPNSINTQFKDTDYIPMVLWGRDHWSTLAYLETKLVEGEDKVDFDPRMRQKRRSFRVLSEKTRLGTSNGEVMRPEHGSRLNNKTYLPWHDDWDCMVDMMHEGLIEDAEFDHGMKIKFTDKGHRIVAALRKHKIEGGTFDYFRGDLT